jgi:hypothetical protein
MKITITTVALLLCCLTASAEESKLYKVTVEDAPAKDGTPATFTFKEVERTPTKSVVELSTLVGGSVSGPMLIVKCMCGLTRARGEQFFASKPLSMNPIRFEVTFPKSGPPAGDVRNLKPSEIVFSVSQCDLLKF